MIHHSEKEKYLETLVKHLQQRQKGYVLTPKFSHENINGLGNNYITEEALEIQRLF